jgi:lipopolysaccharide heptosyltransferase II
MKISAVVVTLNEEANIERCLKSLSFADEIIIVDSGSTDKTIPIAKKYADRIIYRQFEGFSSVKNAGISAAKNSWILSVDADEEITPELGKRILAAVSSKGRQEGYYIKRMTFFLGGMIRHSGWGTRDYQLRLFLRNAGRFEGDVHESVRIKGETQRIEEPIYHYSYPDTAAYMAKMERYTDMQAAEKKPLALPRMIFNPVITFFSIYIFKLGFLDGWRGFLLAVYSAYSEFTRFFKMQKYVKAPEKGAILVRMPNWIGDCIIATAFLPALAEKFDRVVLIVKKGTEEVFSGNPHAASMIIYDKKGPGGFFNAVGEIKRTGIKAAVSLSPSLSSHLMLNLSGITFTAGYSDDLGKLLLARAYKRDKTHKRENAMTEYSKVLSLLGMKLDLKKLRQELYIDTKEEKKFLKDSGFRNSDSGFVFAPFAGFGPSKTWPLEYYEELAASIIRKNRKNNVYITGGGSDGPGAIRQALLRSKQFHDLRGIPLRQAFMLIKKAKLFVGNDSGLMHAADALDTPSVIIFGGTAPYWGGPLSKKAKVIYRGMDCQPCFRKTCRFGHYRCLKEVGVREVLRLIKH